jgi:hypothetical protein
MKLLTSLAGGLAGAIAVTILHELIRKNDPSAPRLDKLGEQATAHIMEKTGHAAPAKDKLYTTAMVGDIIGNTLFYSLAGTRMKKAMSTGGLLGLSAGIGALKLPGVLGLNPKFTNSTGKRRWVTVGLYLTGGLIAAGVAKWLDNKASKKPVVARTKAPDEAYKPVLDITV